ncbi:hypothetical protein PHISCL_07074 [Aspergillus sclerotialis]|uniref:ABM domain-containing protein n=1 Tax=Aspergillus sclerotialis TaxID=2070753 RepID=A0A3A2ZBV8_9EURO|nr:hypothetical protein PHISCL_07074 [Aspergillus sclerotialis]
MPANVTEFIFFKIRPDIKPEDPKSSEAGESLLTLFNDTKQQHGYLDSAWGRTFEDDDFVVWAVDWTDTRGASRAKLLTPFLQPETEVLTMYTTLTPSMSIKELCKNPVTQLCPLTFPTSLTPDEHSRLNTSLANIRTQELTSPVDDARPLNWFMGHVDRPGIRTHPTSPSGEAFVVLMVIGWESVEAHVKVRDTEQFRGNLEGITDNLLPTGSGLLPGESLGMTHVKFQEL